LDCFTTKLTHQVSVYGLRILAKQFGQIVPKQRLEQQKFVSAFQTPEDILIAKEKFKFRPNYGSYHTP